MASSPEATVGARRPTCSVEDCTNLVLCRSLCNAHYQHFRTNGIAMPQRSKRYHDAIYAQHKIARILRERGRAVEYQPFNCPYDLLVDGYKVEVKNADMHMIDKFPAWTFNIRRGTKKPEVADFYVLRMRGVPFTKSAIHILLKSPIGCAANLQISFNSFLKRYAAAAYDFDAFANGTYGKKELAA